MNVLCGLIAVAASTAACVKYLPGKALLPTLTFVLAYGATTVVGASFLLDPFGQAQFQYFMGTDTVQYMATLGGLSYWSLLLMPLALAPIGAIVGYKLSQPTISGIANSFVTLRLWLPSAALLLILLTAYCAYKLWLSDALVPLAAVDPKICIEEKIQRRMDLINSLGNHVYKVLYTAVPILVALTLADAIQRKKRSPLILSGLSILLGTWLCVALYMKAPILIILIGAAVAGMASGISGVIVLPTAIAVGAVIFTALSVTQVCKAPNPTSTVYHLPMGKSPAEAVKLKLEPPGKEASADQKILYYAVQVARAPIFRMAAGFPYYVDIFSNPIERCGVWAPHIFPSSCFPPIKAYEVAYPFKPHGTTGYLPAPVNTSALAEAGYLYSVAATLLVGFIIGLISMFCGYRTPFSVAATVAACIFAYYASQVSLTASLIDSYGLVWLALTIVVTWIVSFLARSKKSEPS
ncbi:putative RecA/RadA family phage recombinase [Nitrobacteraceae bacterium AZCC 1564]